MNQDQKKLLEEKMNKAIAVLEKSFSGLRTGRASIHFLDPVVVEAYGNKMPISQVSTVSTPDSQTLTVQVWDKAMVKAVEKAIADANLGLNPSADSQLIRMSLPPLSAERRKELVKLVHNYAENAKVSVRNIRRDGMTILKKMEKDNEISKDEHHTHSDEIQKLTDNFIKMIDNKSKLKEEEISVV